MATEQAARRRLLGLLLAGGLVWAGAAVASAEDGTGLPLKVKSATARAGLNETITVEVEGLSAWAKKAENSPSKLILYLNGRALKNVNAKAVDLAQNKLQFDLKRYRDSTESREAWARLLGKPDGFERLVALSVGLEGGSPVPTRVDDGKRFSLIVIRKGWFWIFTVLLAFALVLFAWLARASDILRDTSTAPALGQRRLYSLARTQMAFWFFLVIASYIAIWLITDDRDIITDSVLGLIGISAGTAVGAAIVDASKAKAAASATLPASSTGGSTAPPTQPAASKGFVTDILSDSTGISFHRFQIAVWTLVLGLIFVESVYSSLAMPEFSGMLLGLQGISAGTYIGFKFPEK